MIAARGHAMADHEVVAYALGVVARLCAAPLSDGG